MKARASKSFNGLTSCNRNSLFVLSQVSPRLLKGLKNDQQSVFSSSSTTLVESKESAKGFIFQSTRKHFFDQDQRIDDKQSPIMVERKQNTSFGNSFHVRVGQRSLDNSAQDSKDLLSIQVRDKSLQQLSNKSKQTRSLDFSETKIQSSGGLSERNPIPSQGKSEESKQGMSILHAYLGKLKKSRLDDMMDSAEIKSKLQLKKDITMKGFTNKIKRGISMIDLATAARQSINKVPSAEVDEKSVTHSNTEIVGQKRNNEQVDKCEKPNRNQLHSRNSSTTRQLISLGVTTSSRFSTTNKKSILQGVLTNRLSQTSRPSHMPSFSAISDVYTTPNQEPYFDVTPPSSRPCTRGIIRRIILAENNNSSLENTKIQQVIEQIVESIFEDIRDLQKLSFSDIQIVSMIDRIPGLVEGIRCLVVSFNDNKLLSSFSDSIRALIVVFLSNRLFETIPSSASHTTEEFSAVPLRSIDISLLQSIPLDSWEELQKRVQYFQHCMRNFVEQKQLAVQKRQLEDIKNDIKHVSFNTKLQLNRIQAKNSFGSKVFKQFNSVQENISHFLERRNYIKQLPFIAKIESQEESLGQFSHIHYNTRVRSKNLNELTDVLRDFHKYS